MQKLINALALTSFAVSGCVVGAGAWVYVNRYKIVNDVKNIAADEIMNMVPDLMSGMLAPPSLPIPAPGAPSAVGGSTGSPVAIPTLPFGS
jgi:hypothetical protein